MTRLAAAAVLGGVAALAALGVVLLAYGRHDPSPPSLRDRPNPAIPGEIAYFDDKGCIVRAAASGAHSEQVYCTAQGGSYLSGPFLNLSWLDADTLVYSGVAAGGPARWLTLDLKTRTVRDTGVAAGTGSRPGTLGGQPSPKGEICRGGTRR